MVCLAKCFFGGLGYHSPKSTQFQETSGLLALPPSAARPKNNHFLKNMWFVGLGAPGLQKTTWPKSNVGIPLRNPMFGFVNLVNRVLIRFSEVLIWFRWGFIGFL